MTVERECRSHDEMSAAFLSLIPYLFRVRKIHCVRVYIILVLLVVIKSDFHKIFALVDIESISVAKPIWILEGLVSGTIEEMCHPYTASAISHLGETLLIRQPFGKSVVQ